MTIDTHFKSIFFNIWFKWQNRTENYIINVLNKCPMLFETN